MNNPLVSVILPLYKEPVSFATKAIESIINQTYTNIEIIIALDNNNNESLANLINHFREQDDRIIIKINEQNIGLPSTLNRCIDICKGSYVVRMDGDDISHPTRISKQVNFLMNNPNIDLVGCDADIIDENSCRIGYYKNLRTDFAQKMMLKYIGSNLIHPTWVGKANIFKTIRYRNFMYCEDYDFLLRAYIANFNFYNIQEPLLSYRIVQKSIYSISRQKAYEQYVNSRIARSIFNDYIKNKREVYPLVPIIKYDSNRANKYSSIVIIINELRTSVSQHKICKIIRLSGIVFFKYPVILIHYGKALLLRNILAVIEKFC